MKLSDRHIRQYLDSGKIKISPYPNLDVQLGSISIDLRLSSTFITFDCDNHAFIDTKSDIGKYQRVINSDGEFMLHSRGFAIASTIEWVELCDDIIAELHGRSSIARIGILVHGTSSLVDPGWRGNIVLELHNVGPLPIKLYSGMRICALTFEKISSKVDVPYYRKKNRKYINQTGTVGSEIDMDDLS